MRKDDRYRRRRCLRGEGWSGRPCRKDNGHLLANQIGGQRRQSIILTIRPTVFDGDVFALDIAHFFETALEAANERNPLRGGWAPEKPDCRWCRLLRVP